MLQLRVSGDVQVLRVDILSRPDIEKVKKQAHFYKYNEQCPTMFSDTERFIGYLKIATRAELMSILSKMHFIKKLIHKHYFQLRNEIAMMKWYKKGMPLTHSIPRYNTALIKDPWKKKLYVDRLFRWNTLTDGMRQTDKYERLKAKFEAPRAKIPPAMSNNVDWYRFFYLCNDLKQIEELDSQITKILNSFKDYKDHWHDSEKIAAEYLSKRKTLRAEDIPIVGRDKKSTTVRGTKQKKSTRKTKSD